MVGSLLIEKPPASSLYGILLVGPFVLALKMIKRPYIVWVKNKFHRPNCTLTQLIETQNDKNNIDNNDKLQEQ